VLSELEIIERIARLTTTRAGVAVGIGDDAAVLAGSPATVVTQDLLVDGVHFRRGTSGMADIGHKALAVNLSDVAAMGAAPVAAIVGLGLPDVDPLGGADLDLLYGAMEALAARHDVTIAGGDVTRAPALVLSVTAIGTMAAGVAPVLRSGARPGDLLCVTGTLGAAAAGLAVLDDPRLATGLTEADALREASLRPTPRVAAGRSLAAGGATAMLDCSDGLALDALRLARASGATVELDLDRVPVAGGVAAVAARLGIAADVLAATGGDDYELIVTVPPDGLDRARRDLDVGLSVVGRVVTGPGVLRLRRDGVPVELGRLGWEHRPGVPAD
jgi:thiamine-monophosphate kinase